MGDDRLLDAELSPAPAVYPTKGIGHRTIGHVGVRREFGFEGDMGQYRAKLIDTIVERLNPVEQFVIINRFGFLDDGEGWTFGEISEKIGRTRERCRQIEREALKKLRRCFVGARNSSNVDRTRCRQKSKT